MPRLPGNLRLLLALVLALSSGVSVRGEGAPPPAPLTDFAGVYAYRNGTTVALVPAGQELIAIIDSAEYGLQRVGGDEFRNGVGQPVRFVRDAAGKVTGVKEGDDYFPLQTAVVPPEIVRLTVPRDPGSPPYRYRPPVRREDGLAVGPADAAGFSTATLDGLVRSILDRKYPRVHGVLLWRGGRLVFEEYFYGYGPDRPHQLRSATKSIFSLLTGIAMDLGKVRGDKQPIAELLPWPVSSYANPDPRKARITIGDLLSMRSGLACDDWDGSSPGGEQHIYSQPDWARFTIDQPMAADPGTVAHYCSGGVHLTGRILEHATGEDLLTFARRRLFAPLGFKDYRWPYQPVAKNAGTFGQIYLRPRDMLKLGLLVLDGGRWQGRQLVSREWIERSTAAVTRMGSRRYGYFWWHQTFDVPVAGRTENVDTILASGNGGQKIYIVPSLRLVAVLTGGNYNASEDSPPNAILGNVILPELLAKSPSVPPSASPPASRTAPRAAGRGRG